MKKIYPALSIVQPAGQRIAQGIKKLEIRPWQPEHLPLKDLVIVENQHYLTKAGEEEQGLAVAMMDIESVHVWTEDEVETAQASYWAEGYSAWVITNVRPIHPPIPVLAQRKIYFIEIDHA